MAGPGLSCGMWAVSCSMHVGSRSLTRDRTQAPCIGSVESYPLDHQGRPMSFVLWWGNSWWAPGWGLVTRKTTPWLETWNFQPHPHFSGEGRGAGNGINNWSCLHDETSTKIPIVGGKGSFQVGEHVHIPGGWWTKFHRDRSSCTWDPPPDFLSYPFYMSFIISLNKLVNIAVSLNSVSCYSKLIKLQERVMRPSSL